jgi:ubiquinone/menaquinone biosynthesis C-methylase UbiE
MNWTDDTYYNAFDHNYRVAYEEGSRFLGEGSSQENAFQRLEALLQDTQVPAHGTKLLDLGCGDGTNSLFLSGLGYEYTGIDVSPTAVETACRRAREAKAAADIRVGNAMDLSAFKSGEFRIVLDSYCFQMLVIDEHRAAYFEKVKRVLADDGFFILLAQRDDSAYEGAITSFDEFCALSGTDPGGVPHQKCIDGQWTDVEDKKVFLLGRPRSRAGYKKELTNAGFEIIYQTEWENSGKIGFSGFVLSK